MNNLFVSVLFLVGIQLSANAKTFKLNKLEFDIKTNVPGVEFRGHLKRPIQFDPKQGLLIPLEDLTTELDLRDQHMREKIFKGQKIRVHGILKCKTSGDCIFKGPIVIGGISKNIELKGKKGVFSTSIFLSQFELTPPRFMGVQVNDEIPIRFIIDL